MARMIPWGSMLAAMIATVLTVSVASGQIPSYRNFARSCRDGGACDVDRQCNGQCLVRLCDPHWKVCPTETSRPLDKFHQLLSRERLRAPYESKFTGYSVRCRPARRKCSPAAPTCVATIGSPLAGTYPCTATMVGLMFKGSDVLTYRLFFTIGDDTRTKAVLQVEETSPGVFERRSFFGGDISLPDPDGGAPIDLPFAPPRAGEEFRIELITAAPSETGAIPVHGTVAGSTFLGQYDHPDAIVSVRFEF